MKIVEVIPFTKGAGEPLSYFTAQEIDSGMIVSIPLRKREVFGLVVSTGDVRDEKGMVRASPYALKKIKKIIGPSIFTQEFIEGAKEAAQFFASSPGEIIDQIVPQAIFEKYKELLTAKTERKKEAEFKLEKFAFQREFDERLIFYKTLIRTEFARENSILIILPTIEGVLFFADELSRGIERYVYSMHSGLSKKEIVVRYNKATLESHPVLILSTPYFIFMHRPDLRTLVVEQESSGAYYTQSRPYLDLRVVAEILATLRRQKIIFADTILSVETLSRHEGNELLELYPLKWRIESSAEARIIDQRAGGQEFHLIGGETKKEIRKAFLAQGRVFVYTVRRGLRPITLCNDCGTTLTCANCSSPLVLHGREKGGARVFVCHKCKIKRSADSKCQHCGGWRLVALGYGSESVYQELKNLFPETAISIIDKDTAKTPRQAKKKVKDFESKKAGILVGTELALQYLTKPLDTIVVASIDSLFNIPSFRINEKIFHMINALRQKSQRLFLIQTRLKDTRMLASALSGNIMAFYREEMKERNLFHYPPESRIIKLTLQGKKGVIEREGAEIERLLAYYAPERFSAFILKIKNLYRIHIALRLPRASWSLPTLLPNGTIDEELSKKLRALPPSVAVRVDPQDLL
ncbi:MAG: hypothetical protein AAB507_00140 [Patescibacteria group bacterium]